MRLRKHLSAALLAALLSAVAFLWASPFLWTLIASFRPESAGSAGMASLWPDFAPTSANFRNALDSGSFGLYYANTLIVVVGVLAVQCATVSLGNHDRRAELFAEFGPEGYFRNDDGFLHYTIDGHEVRLIGLDTVVPAHGHGEMCTARLAWLEGKLGEERSGQP